MKQFFAKPFRWAAIYALLLAAFAAYILLYTFALPRAAVKALPAASAAAETAEAGEDEPGQDTPVVTDNSYRDDNISIIIKALRLHDTDIYIADITITSAEYLGTAFAQDTYGRNIRAATSEIAEGCGAILAVNGDYYGFRDTGFVLRNGVLYRAAARDFGSDESLAIDASDNFMIFHESRTDARDLLGSGVAQVLSFGPALVENGEVTVTAGSEVARSMGSNPRTAIGQVSFLHYIMAVSDGRTDASQGLTLLELAQVMRDYGCVTAYNLDGGGSSTLWFNGRVINHPVNGRASAERSVSDIVCVGY